ncbi:hypothetical protein L1887_38445 [Cichorium endivia]|nr:hypothetical protein L1887_38445 [Cichorium endivia]
MSMEATAEPPQPSLSLPWTTRIALYVLSTVASASYRKNGTVNRRISNLADYRCPRMSKPINGVGSHDVVVDEARTLWFRVYVPTQHADEDLPHRYPAQHDDCFDVLKFLDDEENRSKPLPENANLLRCFLAGDSAGGNLSHHVSQRACEFNFRRLKITGVVAIQPFFGGEERTESEIRLAGAPLVSIKHTDWMWNAILPQSEGFNRDHPIINVSGPNALDISEIDLPPIMVVVGGFDVLLDWQKRYYEWLKKSGKEVYLLEYPNMCHFFYVFPELPEAEQLIAQVRDFIHKVSSNTNK